MVMQLMRYLFHYCDHKKRSFQSKMCQKLYGGHRTCWGSFSALPDPLAELGGGMGSPLPRKGERREKERRELQPPYTRLAMGLYQSASLKVRLAITIILYFYFLEELKMVKS